MSSQEKPSDLEKYIAELSEVVQSGVGKSLTTKKTIRFGLAKGDSKRGIEDLVIEFEVSPNEVSRLDPLQQFTLVLYAFDEKSKNEDFDREDLQLLGRTLDVYGRIHSISGGSTRIEATLKRLMEHIPDMIEELGYVPASAVLQNFAQESILDGTFMLSGNELSAIIRNIKNNPNVNYLLQDFHTWDGLKTYLFVDDEEANEQIREVVWKSVPRLIEGKGYVRYPLGKLRLVDAELAKYGYIGALVEKFEATVDGDVYYIVPSGQKVLEDYNLQLARQERRTKRQAEQQTKRRPQVNRTPHLPVTQPPIEEKAKAPKSAGGGLETTVTNGLIVNVGALNEEYQHPVYSYLSELRSNLHSLLSGDKRSRQAALTASNRVLDYVNGLTQPIGRDVAVQLGGIVKDSKGVKKLGENTVWNQVTELHKNYVSTYGSFADKIVYNIVRLVRE